MVYQTDQLVNLLFEMLLFNLCTFCSEMCTERARWIVGSVDQVLHVSPNNLQFFVNFLTVASVSFAALRVHLCFDLLFCFLGKTWSPWFAWVSWQTRS